MVHENRFIADDDSEGWSVRRYLLQWCGISKRTVEFIPDNEEAAELNWGGQYDS